MSQKQIRQYAACTSPNSSDVLLGQGNSASTTFKYSVSALFSGLTIPYGPTPNSSTVAAVGKCWQNNNVLYIATATNIIKKIDLQDL